MAAWLSPARLQCYSPAIITQPRITARFSKKAPSVMAKIKVTNPVVELDPDHLAVHQGQADQPVP
jgi:hypothetical protein